MAEHWTMEVTLNYRDNDEENDVNFTRATWEDQMRNLANLKGDDISSMVVTLARA